MKLQCDVEVVSRMLPTFGMKRKGKGVRAVLSIGKHVDKNTQRNIYLMICTAKDRAGSKYKVGSCLSCWLSELPCHVARINLLHKTNNTPTFYIVMYLTMLKDEVP